MQGAHRLRARVSARLLAALAVVGVLLASRAPAAHAIPSATMSMSPSSQSLTAGDNMLVVVSISNATNINDVAFRLTYDPSVVSVTDYDNGTAGTQILPGWYPGTDLNYQTEGVVLANSVNPAGQINYEYMLNNNAEVSGGGTVATIQFVAQANGNADLQWSWVQVKDGSGNPSTPALGDPTIIVVGGAVPTATPTTPATATPTRTSTPLATATNTPAPTETPAATATGSPTPATTTTATPATTNTPAPTSTPRITVVSNSNSTPTVLAKPPASSVQPAASGKTAGLPSAGNDGARTQWWKWSFFGGSIMLALAGWFFTFAVHTGDKEVILTDRFDRRRLRRRR